MNKALRDKLKTLPSTPGVYFHKSADGEIIYVGKAAVLKNRVRHYFQASKTRDAKTRALVAEIVDTDWMEVDSEVEALFLEAEMVRRYMPRYNILLRDDKALSYIRIDYDSDHPTVSVMRRPLDDGARYFGPYYSAASVRQTLKLLRKIFPYATKQGHEKRASLHYYIGLDPGLESGRTSLRDYRKNLRRLMAIIQGKKKTLVDELTKEMTKAAADQQFELAATIRNQLRHIKELDRRVVFSDKEFLDISKDHALNELAELLGLTHIPARIEGYDISHMSGSNVVASMVVFTNGVSNRGEYRKFKMSKEQNNDFYNMNETIRRRFREKNIASWGMADMFLIDGGKGQLDAAIEARDACGQSKVVFIGLAKREEQIVIDRLRSGVELNMERVRQLGGYITESETFTLINLPHSTHVIKLLQRIRDESHRFAVSYHSTLKQKKQSRSRLDEIVGVGPVTRKKLLKRFGSVSGISKATEQDIAQVVGDKLARIVYNTLQS